MNVIDDFDQFEKEAGNFMELRDDEILVSERLQRHDRVLSARDRSQEYGKSYLLNRFISDTRATPAREPQAMRSTIKSMQHFFLKVGGLLVTPRVTDQSESRVLVSMDPMLIDWMVLAVPMCL